MGELIVPELHVAAGRDGGVVLVRPNGVGGYELVQIGSCGDVEQSGESFARGEPRGWEPLEGMCDNGYESLGLALEIANDDLGGLRWVCSVMARRPSVVDRGLREVLEQPPAWPSWPQEAAD